MNNYTEYEYDAITRYCSSAKYAIVGKEVGANGTPHLQGYVAFTNARSFKSIKEGLGDRAHIERARGSGDDNRKYCSKDGDYWEQGDCPEKIGGNNIAEKIAKNKRLLDQNIPLDDLIENGDLSAFNYLLIKRTRMDILTNLNPYTPADVRGLWIWGKPGCGKTRHVWDTYGATLYEKAQNKWFDGYSGEKNILLDDLDTDVLGHYLKRWMDRYPVKGEVKGGTLQLQHDLFIVTSNYKIEELFKCPILAQAIRRRCKVLHFASL